MAIDTQLISTIPKVCTDDWRTPVQMAPRHMGTAREEKRINKKANREKSTHGVKNLKQATYNTAIKQRVCKYLQIGNVGIFIQCGNCAVILLCKLLKLNVLTLGIYWHACAYAWWFALGYHQWNIELNPCFGAIEKDMIDIEIVVKGKVITLNLAGFVSIYDLLTYACKMSVFKLAIVGNAIQ